ncbi:lipoprotein [Klebsiella pneumoniae]|nr:lipoprotein [Klebsiella pneumoniae]
MKQTHYFTVNFTGFTTAASEEQSYLRLIAGEHAFYTDKRHFKDPSLFDRLRLGQPLHIGTCRLKDGSYWIHWLSDGHILLEPSRQPLSIKKASSTCRLGLFCLLDHSRLCSMVGYFFYYYVLSQCW